MAEKKTIFEELGYDKFTPKPHYETYALVQVTDGWAVFRIKFKGLQVDTMELVSLPAPKALAKEQYRIHIGRQLLGV
jgi:hypothetical protein